MNIHMISKERLLEPDIKALVLNHLKDNGRLTHDASIINEFTIDKFSRRVDLAAIENKSLVAFEIKSEADSLYRLGGQVEKYLEYFDRVTIVAASKHIEQIIKTIPHHVGVWEVSSGKIKIKRPGKRISIRDKSRLIGLMKASELLKLSNKLNLTPPSKTRLHLEAALQESSSATLKQAAIQSIKERFYSTYSLFLNRVADNRVLPEDIQLLSPYRKERLALKELTENNAIWSNWSENLNEDPHLVTMSKRNDELMFGEVPTHIQDLMST